MPAKRIPAKEFAQDVRAGMHPTTLKEKYELSPNQFQTLVQKCIDAGVLSRADVAGLKGSPAEDAQEHTRIPAETVAHVSPTHGTGAQIEETPQFETTVDDGQEPFETTECPACGKALRGHADRCMYCGHWFDGRDLGIGEDSSSLSPAQLGLILLVGGVLGMSISTSFLWLGTTIGAFLTIVVGFASFGCYLYGCGLYMKSKGYTLLGGLLGLLALPGLIIMYLLPERRHDL